MIGLVFLVGYVSVVYTTIKVVAHLGAGFVDEELVEQAIFHYQNNIGGCFPPLNITK